MKTMNWKPQMLFVAWQHADSRAILPIGRLLRVDDGYEFAYINAVERARRLGFEPLVTFPDIETVYECAELPPLFGNRVMNRSRNDFASHAAELALPIDEAEPFTLLSRTGGRRTTDKLEVFAPPTLHDDKVEGLFLARGVRHVPGSEAATPHLSPDDPLYVLADLQNSVTSSALALRTEECQLLGYVPDYLAQELAHQQAPPKELRVSVVRVNPDPAPVHHRLLCRFEYPADVGSRLFRGEGYQPISSEATPTSANAA